jgi:5-methyltetrahydrofolate--homocysteine methyltransferase
MLAVHWRAEGWVEELNQTFMITPLAKGLHGAIVNPLDRRVWFNTIDAETLVGRDDNFCMNYLKALGAGMLEG